MTHWTDFGLRQMPFWSARQPADFAPEMQARIEGLVVLSRSVAAQARWETG
jgi:hypothetical protein